MLPIFGTPGVDEDICDDRKQAEQVPLDVEYDPASFEWDARRFEAQVLRPGPARASDRCIISLVSV